MPPSFWVTSTSLPHEPLEEVAQVTRGERAARQRAEQWAGAEGSVERLSSDQPSLDKRSRSTVKADRPTSLQPSRVRDCRRCRAGLRQDLVDLTYDAQSTRY
jgi:hypothetical protein